MNLQLYESPSAIDEFKKLSKKYIYCAAIAGVGSMLLGDANLDEKGSVLGMSVPLAVSAGLGAGVGTVVSDLTSDFVVNRLFDDSTIRNTERMIVGTSLAAGGSVLGLKYLSGLPPSLDGAILGAASHVGANYMYSMDDGLLGRLY